MKAPRIGYQDGGKPKRPLDYTKSKQVDKTEEQLLSEGYKKDVKDGKVYYYKESEASAPKRVTPPSLNKTAAKTGVSTGTGAPQKPRPTPRTETKPTDTYNQEIVHLKESPPTVPPKVGVNTDVSARGEEKRNDYGNYYTISYPDLKNGSGMSGATVRAFNNDSTKGPIGADLGPADDLTKHFNDKGYNPIFTGKTQADFTPENLGQTAIMSNDINKNSVSTQLDNSQNPVEMTGNKFQENTSQGLNTQGFDKSSQGINTGLMDINKLPTTELKKRDANVAITSPTFKAGGKITKAPKGIKKLGYDNGGDVYDPNNPISANNQLKVNGTEFQAQGDYPLTTQQNNKQNVDSPTDKRNLGQKVQGSLGWLGIANQAQQTVRGAVDKDTVVDPYTGQMISKPKTFSGDVINTTATPIHEHVLNSYKQGNLGRDLGRVGVLGLLAGPLGAGGGWIANNALYGQSDRDNAFNQAKYHQQMQMDADKRQQAFQNAYNDRDIGKTMTNSTYISNLKAPTEEVSPLDKIKNKIGFADGGKIVGKGTGKSDSINANIKEGAEVVPVENAHIAKEIRKVVLKKAPSVKANLKQGGGIPVKLSNGEVLFSKKEAEKVEEKLGEDVFKKLAPNAERKEDIAEHEYDEIEKLHMAHGGELTAEKAKTMLRDDQANGKPLTTAQKHYFGFIAGGGGKAEGGTVMIEPSHRGRFTEWAKEHKMSVAEAANHVMANKDKYDKHVIMMANFAKNFTGKYDGGMIGYKDGGYISPEEKKAIEENKRKETNRPNAMKRLADIDKEEKQLLANQGKAGVDTRLRDIRIERDKLNRDYNISPKTASVITKAPTGIKKVTTVNQTKPTTENKTTNENYVSPQDYSLADYIGKQNKPQTKMADVKTTSPAAEETSAETGNKKPNFSWSAWTPALGSAVETAASLGQINLGLKNLNQTGSRPVGQIDPTFQANVNRAQANANYGFGPEQWAQINQENQNATNLARASARAYSGGSGGNAFNMERSAINEGWGRGLAAKVASNNYMMDKQNYATDLSLQKAGMSRQLFEDKLNAWNQNQYANQVLLGKGISNLVGAGRYASELAAQQDQNKYYNI